LAAFHKEVLAMDKLQDRKVYETPLVTVETGFEQEVLASGSCQPDPDTGAFEGCGGYTTDQP
jgi:hypothetical protein